MASLSFLHRNVPKDNGVMMLPVLCGKEKGDLPFSTSSRGSCRWSAMSFSSARYRRAHSVHLSGSGPNPSEVRCSARSSSPNVSMIRRPRVTADASWRTGSGHAASASGPCGSIAPGPLWSRLSGQRPCPAGRAGRRVNRSVTMSSTPAKKKKPRKNVTPIQSRI